MKTIELTDEFVEHIVITELQDMYERNLVEDRDEGGFPLGHNEELLKAIEVVLQYVMPFREAKEYIDSKRKRYAL